MEGTPDDLAAWRAVDLGALAAEDPLAQMYYGLADAIERDTEPPSSGREGRTAFEMVLGLYQSHRLQGRRVELPLDQRRHPLEVWRQEAS